MADEKELSSVISIVIKDKQALYMAYMPYLKDGGLFVSTKKEFDLGDEVFLLVKIMDDPEPLKISGKVVWISPAGSYGNRPRGVGLQFTGEEAKKAVSTIENKLGTTVTLSRTTHTM